MDKAVGNGILDRLKEKRAAAGNGLSGLNGDPAKATTQDDREKVRKKPRVPVRVLGLAIGLWAALIPVGMLAAIVGGASDIPVLLQAGKLMIVVVLIPLVLFLFSDIAQVFGLWPDVNKKSKSASEDGVEN